MSDKNILSPSFHTNHQRSRRLTACLFGWILILSMTLVGCSSNKPNEKELAQTATQTTTPEPSAKPTPEPTAEPTPEPTPKPTPEPVELSLQQFEEAVANSDLDHSGIFAVKDGNTAAIWNTPEGEVYFTASIPKGESYDTTYIVRITTDGYILISDSEGIIYLMDGSASQETSLLWSASLQGLATTLDSIHVYEKLNGALAMDFVEENMIISQPNEYTILVEYSTDGDSTYTYHISTEDYHLMQCSILEAAGTRIWANMDMFVVFPDEYHESADDNFLSAMSDTLLSIATVFAE